MGKPVQRFEDLIAWQKARELNREVRAITRSTPFRADLSLADQMRRSSRSIMGNLAEGFERASRPEFHRFIVTAKGSCGELRSDLYSALDDRFLTQTQFDALKDKAEELSRIIGGLRAAVARQRTASK